MRVKDAVGDAIASVDNEHLGGALGSGLGQYHRADEFETRCVYAVTSCYDLFS